MRNRGQPIRKAFGREFGKVVNQRYRPKLGNNISTLDLRNQGYNSVIQARDIDSTKTETLNDATRPGQMAFPFLSFGDFGPS